MKDFWYSYHSIQMLESCPFNVFQGQETRTNGTKKKLLATLATDTVSRLPCTAQALQDGGEADAS